jgi:hypothetical protein
MQEVLLQLQADRTEARSYRIQILKDQQCLKDSFVAYAGEDKKWKDKFEEKYVPYLTEKLVEKKLDDDARMEVRKSWAVRKYNTLIWLLLGALGFVLYHGKNAKEVLLATLK